MAKIPGTLPAPPLLVCAHVDTVEPGRGIEPVFENGTFRSKGDTILGSDDKSAVAVILETLASLAGNREPHGPLEIVLTVAEEIGLLGAKNLDYSMLSARMGFVLDASDPDAIITRAPSANRMTYLVRGKSAHAGSSPEKGINAIAVAAKAIASLALGRIDFETTANIGVIDGGSATNIVPDRVTVNAEARSHDEAKLADVTARITGAFRAAVAETNMALPPGLGEASVEVTVDSDYFSMNIPDGHPLVRCAAAAGTSLGRTVATKMTGGGSDANVFFKMGIPTAIMGTGMTDVHTVRESVSLDHMVKGAELLRAVILTFSRGF